MPELLLGLLVAGPVIGVGAWLAWRYHRAQKFRSRGWTFERDPGPAPVWGLNHPPFGRGRGRRVRELVRGEAAGIGFRAVRYESSAQSPPGFVVALPLRRSLPPLVAGDPHAIPTEPVGVPVASPAGIAVLADDPEWGRAVVGALASVLPGWAGGRLACSIDGASIVGLGCGDEPEALESLVPRLAEIAATLERLPADAFPGPFVPPEMALVHHPDWVYRAHDDAMLRHVGARGGGYDHRAVDVMFLASDEVGFIALTHHWKTDRTVTSAGPNGTTTRTVTDHHREQLLDITLGFPFLDLSVNKSFDWGRPRVEFESDDFNRAFTVRCADARFASHVFHPRQMQFLQQARPPGFAIEGRRIRIEWDGRVPTIEWWLRFSREFFGRVPEFVWKDLGTRPPQLMLRWLA